MNKQDIEAVECEEVIIGSVLSVQEHRLEIFDMIKSPDYFVKPEHALIWQLCMEIYNRNEEPSWTNVCVALKANGKLDAVGGKAFVVKLINSARLDVVDCAKIVLQKYVARRVYEIAETMTKKALNDYQYDVLDTIEEAQEDLYDLIKGHEAGREARHLSDMVDDVMEDIHNNHLLYQKGLAFTGITTGFKELNRMTDGWHGCQNIVVAARPAMGKTAFMLTMATRIAQSGKKVGIFTLEMGYKELVKRLLVAETELNAQDLKRGRLQVEEWNVLNKGAMTLKGRNIWIDEDSYMYPAKLRQKVRNMVRKHGLDIIMLDYLQLMDAGDKSLRSANDKISELSKSMKRLAKELDIPVITLSQLNRGPEQRTDKKPQMSDLRDSGAIEQDADVVLMLWRPSYYGITKSEEGDKTYDSTDAVIIVEKNRDGAVGEVDVKFTPELVRFDEKDAVQKKWWGEGVAGVGGQD